MRERLQTHVTLHSFFPRSHRGLARGFPTLQLACRWYWPHHQASEDTLHFSVLLDVGPLG
jgi:hypothetical protein